MIDIVGASGIPRIQDTAGVEDVDRHHIACGHGFVPDLRIEIAVCARSTATEIRAVFRIVCVDNICVPLLGAVRIVVDLGQMDVEIEGLSLIGGMRELIRYRIALVYQTIYQFLVFIVVEGNGSGSGITVHIFPRHTTLSVFHTEITLEILKHSVADTYLCSQASVFDIKLVMLIEIRIIGKIDSLAGCIHDPCFTVIIAADRVFDHSIRFGKRMKRTVSTAQHIGFFCMDSCTGAGGENDNGVLNPVLWHAGKFNVYAVQLRFPGVPKPCRCCGAYIRFPSAEPDEKVLSHTLVRIIRTVIERYPVIVTLSEKHIIGIVCPCIGQCLRHQRKRCETNFLVFEGGIGTRHLGGDLSLPFMPHRADTYRLRSIFGLYGRHTITLADIISKLRHISAETVQFAVMFTIKGILIHHGGGKQFVGESRVKILLAHRTKTCHSGTSVDVNRLIIRSIIGEFAFCINIPAMASE